MKNPLGVMLIEAENGKDRSEKVSTVILLAALCACATANPPPSQFTKNGCTLDLKKVCQYVIDQPGFTLEYDW